MIVTLGDSICWGQGLLEEHKFDRIFAESRGMELNRVAHSGAILGSESDNSTEKIDPEAPASYPSVWQQLAAVESWADVDVAIVNGGLNDVSLGRILSPWVTSQEIVQLTQQFCLAEMGRLLTAAAGKLTKAVAQIAVMGYYPFLSAQTKFDDLKQAQMLMEVHGVATGSAATGKQFDVAELVKGITENSLTFWRTSESGMRTAVAQANKAAGREVCVFVPTPLTEANAVWAPETQLWQLTLLLEAEDEVKAERDRACDAVYGGMRHLLTWFKCDRASLGHPDVSGAARIAGALGAAL